MHLIGRNPAVFKRPWPKVETILVERSTQDLRQGLKAGGAGRRPGQRPVAGSAQHHLEPDQRRSISSMTTDHHVFRCNPILAALVEQQEIVEAIIRAHYLAMAIMVERAGRP